MEKLEFKGTKGEWKFRQHLINKNDIVILREIDTVCRINKIDFDTDEEAEANAKLIADAGTTVNKCGLMPSELLEQRNDLLEALQSMLKEFSVIADVRNEQEQEEAIDKAVKAIEKSIKII